ncbi:MAG: hypothetical protein M1497_11465 [Nitrospirae bacterium]|nr:hypothetical protein [Nitrospirota bacterium]
MKKRHCLSVSFVTVLAIAFAVALHAASSAEAADPRAKTDVRVFVTYKYTDPMTGIEAFRLLIPKGWRVEGKIAWSANPALPAESRFRFYNPNGAEELNFFPTQSYFWTNNRLFLSTNPPGSLRFGTLVMRPVDLRTAFTKAIIPRARAGVRGIRVVEEKPVPELAQIARGEPAAGVRSSAEAGRVRIQYVESGRPMEEELYAAISQFATDMPGSGFTGGYFINYWYIDYVFSFRAEKGGLSARSKVFQTMIYSVKVNPRWFAKVINVKEMLAQQAIRGIKAVGRIGEMVARAGSEMRADQMRVWEQRQQAQDRIARNFSDYIRGVDRFHDPLAGKEVELPSGYGRAWANNLGEYIVSDSPSYNPNVGSNLHWQELTPVK